MDSILLLPNASHINHATSDWQPITFQALHDAASRGASIRILESPGFSERKTESEVLKEEFPERISIHSIQMGDWYGESGIMHQKIWIFDPRHMYLGSANMDWKSIAQVK